MYCQAMPGRTRKARVVANWNRYSAGRKYAWNLASEIIRREEMSLIVSIQFPSVFNLASYYSQTNCSVYFPPRRKKSNIITLRLWQKFIKFVSAPRSFETLKGVGSSETADQTSDLDPSGHSTWLSSTQTLRHVSRCSKAYNSWRMTRPWGHAVNMGSGCPQFP